MKGGPSRVCANYERRSGHWRRNERAVKCPHCKKPGELHMVFLDGRDEHGNHKGWQEMRPCSICKGTGQISQEYARRRELGARMRRTRIEAGETQREAGERLGIHFTVLSKIEAGYKICQTCNRIMAEEEKYCLKCSGRAYYGYG